MPTAVDNHDNGHRHGVTMAVGMATAMPTSMAMGHHYSRGHCHGQLHGSDRSRGYYISTPVVMPNGHGTALSVLAIDVHGHGCYHGRG